MPTEKRADIEFVETAFTYAIPDDFRESTFNDGRTATYIYKGPRYLTFEINKETGKESGWCLIYPEELERPVALDVERVRVDCSLAENGLLCEIANDEGRQDAVEFRANRTWVTYYAAPAGYTNIEKPTETEPRDWYDEFNITYDFNTKQFNVPLHTWDTDITPNITWDDIKTARDKLLRDSDGAYTDDMPEAIKNKWIEYRQKLRDLPDALEDFEPKIAAQMFPPTPE
jgi:hypothetical protein